MTDLQKQFQEEKGVSFDGIPINGIHLEYITWLEARIQALRIHDVVGRSEQFICPCCGSDRTYKTEAYHCNRCAVTTEV